LGVWTAQDEDLGVWTAQDSVLVLIDYQKGFRGHRLGDERRPALRLSRPGQRRAGDRSQGTHLHDRGWAVSRLLKASSLLPPLNRRDFTPAVKG
jgi:hypothetical protein